MSHLKSVLVQSFLSLLALCNISSALAGTTGLANNECVILVASTKSTEEAKGLQKKYLGAELYTSKSGYIAVGVEKLLKSEASSRIKTLINEGKIPKDSNCADSGRLISKIDSNQSPPQKVDTQSGYDPQRYAAMVDKLIENNQNFRNALLNNFDFDTSAKCSMVGIMFMAEQVKNEKVANDENISILIASLMEGTTFVKNTFIAKGYPESNWSNLFNNYKNQFLSNQSQVNAATKECISRIANATSAINKK